MSKPSIGSAITPAMKKDKREMKELTVLNKNSKESIYNLIFSETKEEMIENE